MSTNVTSASGVFAPVTRTKTGSDPAKAFTMETFLKVLGAQMKSQNPMEPLKDTEFIAQMSQYSSLEQITKLNTTMASMALGMQLTQGAAMIGRTVSYLPVNGSTPVTGTVDKLNIGGGKLTLVVGGQPVGIDQVTEVKGS